MFEEREFEGKDLEQALHQAAAVLGIPEPELDYKIVEQGRRGLFGVGAKSVRIRVMPPLGAMPNPLDAIEPPAPPIEPAPAPERPPRQGGRREPAGPQSAQPSTARNERRRGGSRREVTADDIERRSTATATAPRAPVVDGAAAAEIVRTLERMLTLMGLELELRRAPSGGGVTIELGGPDRETLTEKDGDLLQALQFLLNRMTRRNWPEAGPIVLSCNGERTARRDDELVQQTRGIAEQVRKTGRSKRLQPMNAYERRLVHLTVREFERLSSRSEGSGHLKRVKIFRQGDPGNERPG